MDGLDSRPNVVLVVADDLGIGDIGAYGGDVIRTPAIDRLASTGVRCKAMYAAAGWDTPSRAGMLVGRYGARYSLPDSTGPTTTVGLPADAKTIATLLREAGYATGLFGQWRLGSRTGQQPLDHGFDRFSGTLYGTDVSPLAWYQGRQVEEADFDSAYAARRITEDALDFIDQQYDRSRRGWDRGGGRGGRHRGRGRVRPRRPFLAVLSHLAPHQPYRVEPRFVGRSDGGLYGDVVEAIDHYLGRLIRHLSRIGGSDRTLVIFTSDNGPRYEGRNLRRQGRKPELFDGGVNVPFIASWTTAGRARRDSVPRSLLDITPSLCSLAGATPPADLDGADMSQLLLGRAHPARGAVYLFHRQSLWAMRSEQWKFHVLGILIPFGHEYWPTLYDVVEDPREEYTVENLHPDVIARLRPQLDAVAADVAAEAARRAQGTAA
jgi:arylsulfatase A